MASHPSSGFVGCSDGRVALGHTAAGLYRWFGGQFLQMATDAGAEEYRFGPAIARETLARAGYLEAFPDGATSITVEESARPYCLSPAVCYHAYERFAGQRFDRPLIMTAESPCFRDADRRTGGAGRLWEFTMREIVFVGPPVWVQSRRDEWMSRVRLFATSLGLDGSLEPATDLFFGSTGRGKRLLQQVKGLKYELQLAVGKDSLPVASFNLHETFFGERFAMTLEDGRDAHSACVAFGLERWVLVFLEQRGPAAAESVIRCGSQVIE
jgi:seryl-tRNA synthetase